MSRAQEKITFRGKTKTPRQWIALHYRMADPPECENHHLGCSCSSEPLGPCLNHMTALLPEDEIHG